MRCAWLRKVGGPVASIAVIVTLACAASSDTGPNSPSPNSPFPSQVIPAGWSDYTNTQYGFALSYPGEYGIVPETTPPASGANLRVRFQEKALLTSEFVDQEPARFMVEVFVLAQPPALTTWLRSKNRLPADALTSSMALAGAQEGLRVQQRQQLAPNDFYYFTNGNNVFALTPLGAHSAEILASFRLR